MKKVLVIDDERPVREMLKKFLSKRDYEVFEAEDGKTALEVFKEHQPHIVLLDIRMPDMSGVDVLKNIKGESENVGVIMITAVSETAIAEKCMELGAFDYITKPISLGYLEECLLAKLLDFYDK